jgi:hypothetical protein
MAPIIQATLPRMGYVRNLPRDVVYTSEDLCGLGVYHPWYNQHLSQMQILLQETALPTITGDVIRASLEQLRLEIGLPGRSDRWNWGVIDCITTDCWLKYMSQHDFQLADTLPVLRTYRDSDRFLMKEFIAHGYFRKELQMVNECPKHLQVTTLAEISLADGNYLEAWAWNITGTLDPINQYQWPRRSLLQPRSYWLLWQQALQAMFLHPYHGKEGPTTLGTLGPGYFGSMEINRRRKTGCTILKAVVGGFSRRFRHGYNNSALFVFSVRNISPLLLRLMMFWLQSLGLGTVPGSRVLIPFHLGLLTNRKQPHALSARHWTYAKNLINGLCNPQTLLTTAVPLRLQSFEVKRERSVTDPSKM